MTGSLERAPRIGFRSHLRPEVVAGEAVYVFAEHGVTALQGADVEGLAPLLDGSRDLAALHRDLPDGIDPARADDVLRRLSEAGLVAARTDVASEVDSAQLAYWEAAGLDPVGAVAAPRTVDVVALGDLDPTETRTALGGAGLTVASASRDASSVTEADLTVVFCTDYLDPALSEVDAAHRATGTPWLLAKPVGTQVWIGPVFAPGKACWHCLARRMWAHRQGEAHVQDRLGRRGPAHRAVAGIPALVNTGLQLAALEAAKWLAGHRGARQHTVWTLDTLTLDGRGHEVRARPECPECGDADLVRRRAWSPVELTRRARCDSAGTGPHGPAASGSRSASAEDTLARYRHLVSPVTGVVKEIRRSARGPALFNSFRSGPNLAVGGHGLDRLRAGLRTENGGKGVTALDAEVSALCEAVERHCGSFHGDEERLRGSYRALAEDAIHPDSCQLFHPRQFAGRTDWNPRHSAFQHVCDPFDPDTELDWTPVWSLSERRHRLLPTAMLYFDAPGTGTVRADSNGNAAGSSLEDAVLQGLLELVERDAVALWWYNRTRAPGVDLAASGDPWIAEVVAAHAALDRQVWVLDVTSDLGVPVLVALSRRVEGPSEDIMFGFGAHLDPAVALRRCLTELNQLMPAVLGDYQWNDPDAVSWWREATVHTQPYLLPDPHRPYRGPADRTVPRGPDLLAEVSVLRGRIERAGMEVLVLDQTRPDVGLPVVKVVVPGMRGFWARFAPGRLYDVPVRLGRLTEPTRYEDLNPIPLFL